MPFIKQIISSIISLALSLVTALGINVNSGAKEPPVPAEDASQAELIQYYNDLLDATKEKSFVKITEIESFVFNNDPIVIGDNTDQAAADFQNVLFSFPCESKIKTQDELFCKGTGINSEYKIKEIIPPSSLDSNGVASAKLEASGSDYKLTIALNAELDSTNNPAVYTKQCAFLPFGSAFEDAGISTSKSLLYTTTLVAVIGSDGVLKTLSTEVNFNGSIILERTNSFSTSYLLSGVSTSNFTFSYDF
jgi:hypothetical protein